jgi:2,3-bisphosphoglycerate-dependent phosphoglycerate mutase
MVEDGPMMTRARKLRTVWLVRHGETTWNAMGWVQGQIDGARLTRQGRHQARQVADCLASEPIGAVYSSDLYRARRTAAVTAQRLGCDVRTDHRLRERSFGIAEGVPSVKITAAVTGIEDGHVVDEHARAPGGESLSEVHQRCSAFLQHLLGQHEVGDVVVVAHGGSIRMLRALAANIELKGLAWGTVPNAGIFRLDLPLPDLAGSVRGAPGSLAPATPSQGRCLLPSASAAGR